MDSGLFRAAGTLSIVFSSFGGALADAPAGGEPDGVSQRMVALEREVADLRRQLGEETLDARRAEMTKALIREVLSDADMRASLLADGVSAGYDGGFFVGSADGNNLLKIRGLVQLRYTHNTRDEGAGVDEDVAGFDLARTRFAFTGHVIDPSWKYMIWTGHHNNGDSMLLDAYITKVVNDQLSVTVGQFKLPMWREWLVSETSLQFAERSLLTSATLSGKYTQGVKVDMTFDRLRLTASLNDGKNDLNSPWASGTVDYGVTGRAEYLVFGNAKHVASLDSFRGNEPALLLGAAVHHQTGEHGTAASEFDDLTWTADATLALNGANLFAGVVGAQTDDPTRGDRVGFLVQGGVFVTDQLELMARYEHGISDVDGVEDYGIATVGAAYFFSGWNARLVGDVGYAFDAIDAAWSNSAAGYLTDAAGNDGQIVTRLQMQLLF